MREMKAPLSPFLSLMKEKEAKENQGIRDACQVSRVLQTQQRDAGEVVRVLQTQQIDLCQVAGDNHALEKSTRKTTPLSIWGFSLMRKMEAPLSPFLSLMKEKEAKENQGGRAACQVSRVLQT